MVGTLRVTREYECVGGPLDGEIRSASPPPAPDRIYVVRFDSGDGNVKVVECSIVPPYPGWTTVGYYEVRDDDNERRGTRQRLWFHALTTWPVWINKPLTFDPPPTEFPGSPEGFE